MKRHLKMKSKNKDLTPIFSCETPNNVTFIGDCRISGCMNGVASDIADDSDKPNPLADNNNKCKTCSAGNVVVDSSKNSTLCSDVDGEGCFICVDGTCKRPDCDSGPVKTTTGFGSTALSRVLKETFDKMSKNPFFNITNEGIRSSVKTEEGKECCNCGQGNDPLPYKKTTAGVNGSMSFTATAPGLGVALKFPSRTIGFGLEVDGILEVGGVIKGKATAVAEASNKVSACDIDSGDCTEANINGAISLFGGVTFTAEGAVKSCNLLGGGCDDLILLGAATDVGVQSEGGINAKTYLGDSCPNGCNGFYLNEGKAVANLELKALVGGVYEASYIISHEHIIWDKIGNGVCS